VDNKLEMTWKEVVFGETEEKIGNSEDSLFRKPGSNWEHLE
jgi:hypothetical protein